MLPNNPNIPSQVPKGQVAGIFDDKPIYPSDYPIFWRMNEYG